ncbi:MAG: PQQ-dependent sugar dehydrogenase [Betaproteobacteria bacterium]|nr:PQQ-dependent sugar dehydrogenase [Betaproteobacteria bacterium]
MIKILRCVVAICGAAIMAAAHADLPPAPGAPIAPMKETFEKRVVATGLANPHNMVFGPDGYLWLTEQITKRVTRVDPQSGMTIVAAQIDDAIHSEDAQDGLLGLALHPDLLKGKGHDFIYVSMTYDARQGGITPNRTLIRRYTYDAKAQKLASPVDLIKGLPSSHDHQSARLLFGPDQKLYYSIGDQGANQLAYLCVPNQAQTLPTADEVKATDWRHYAGKILRLNLDGTIPADNPVIHGVKSHVYAWGIRNTQGMVFSPSGKLFATDHGPNSDDELNLILRGKNYGWPYVAGRKDNAGYAYANYSATTGGCESVKDPAQNGKTAPPGVPVQKESDWSDPDFVEPIKTLFTVDNDYSYTDPACADKDLFYICWPTIAPSSVIYYKGGKSGVPGWEHSLLIASLKRGVVYRVKLDDTDSLPVGDAQPMFRAVDRYREVVVSPDGGTIYVATDAVHLGTTDAGSAAFKLENPGAILAFKYSAPK